MKRLKVGRQLAVVASLVPKSEPISSARVGWIAGVSQKGRALVDYPRSAEGPFEAVSTVAGSRAELEAAAGRRQAVVLLFDGGDPHSPIIVGFVVPEMPVEAPRVRIQGTPGPAPGPGSKTTEVVEVDGKRVSIEGMDEVVLRCGEASITLRRNGKVIIRGLYVESHSKGTNRIKGGTVEVN